MSNVTIYFSAARCLRAREWAKTQGMLVQATLCIWTGSVSEVSPISALAKEMGLEYERMLDPKTGINVEQGYGMNIAR